LNGRFHAVKERNMYNMFRRVIDYRYFIVSSIQHDLTHHFTASKLGGLWLILSPLFQVLIYVFVLSSVLQSRLAGASNQYAYAIYLMAGLLAWNLFSEIINRCLNLFVEKGNLLKKISFPRIVLPIIVAGSCIVNNILIFLVMLVIFFILGNHFNAQILWLVPLSFSVVVLAMSLGLILGTLNVFMRDISHVVPIMLQILFWFTPIVYPLSIIPDKYRYLLELNPMSSIVADYQQIILNHHSPNLHGMLMTIVISLSLSVFALFLFRRASPEMADVL
jgi:lipopolysaccharide transport system permease protein